MTDNYYEKLRESVLEQVSEEESQEDIEKTLAIYNLILSFAETGKFEGLLGFEEASRGLSTSGVEGYLKYILLIINEGTDYEDVEEAGITKAISGDYKGRDILRCLMCLKGMILTMEGHTPYTVGRLLWAHLTQSEVKELRKRKEVGLFFYVGHEFVFYGTPLADAEKYGDFLIHNESHLEAWNRLHYKCDYDYYPRGRVVYRITDDTFIIYYDRCIADEIWEIAEKYRDYKVKFELDEHYCCHNCNENYVE